VLWFESALLVAVYTRGDWGLRRHRLVDPIARSGHLCNRFLRDGQKRPTRIG